MNRFPGFSTKSKGAGRMKIENELATYIISEVWDELFGDEEYDVDQLTDKLNKEIKRIKKRLEEQP